MAHLTYETILNYLEEQLTAQERSEADKHFNSPCASCQRRRVLLQTAFRSSAEDQTISPPASVLKLAVDIPLAYPSNAQPGLLTRLVAALTFDSSLQFSSALTRGAARERQMLFSVEQVDIDLHIKSAYKGHDLIGQVLAEQTSGNAFAFVSLQGNTGQLLKATEADSKGQFAFHGLTAGLYDLIFDLEKQEQEIAVIGIEVTND